MGVVQSGIISGVGDRFSQVAVLTLILQVTGSGMAVGTALGMRIFPYLFLSPIGGKAADRIAPQYLMIAADLLRIPFALSFALIESDKDMWMAFTGIFVLSCGEAFYQPIRKSTIGKITEPSQLTVVNGLEQFRTGVVLILGSVTGGAAAYFFGTDIVFVFNAVSFAAAAFLIRKLEVKKNPVQENSEPPRIEMKARDWLSTGILLVVFIQWLGAGMDGIFNVMISVYAVEIFSSGELGVGLLYGALGTGLMTSFFLMKLVKRHPLLFSILALVVEGVLQGAASQAGTLYQLMLSFFVIALIGGMSGAFLDTLVMKRIPSVRQGSVFGFIESGSNVILGMTMVGGGLAVDVFPIRNVGFTGGMVGFFSGLLILMYRLFRHKYLKKQS
ncbi:MFS transporter [Halobacillus halophilus]|uniref:MFS-type transporter n=1 Tax=Halobacillus halophilus (strain ATCC 35676 / DSM 2266 / JCM 20832 / KCTC 3685 / LMG 17431 / NBRC 102448 / NCIMB 2269) TaxID=866895 RepID=I0JLP4_HALH3|nr:MFS transporter [Halobacillus halophilus]ASF39169.1 MFS transporter [Halobacillus halophilus]CCG45064.1 putative MFS-type transporter [Halobacillus halophilus DSM 2266]